MMTTGFVVAIDGPAGAGKSTVAKLVAEELGYAYIDTGAMYRAVTLKLINTGTAFSPEAVGRIARGMHISFKPDGKVNRVFADGLEITEAIRSTAVTDAVSRVAALGAVREAMVAQQRRMGQEGNVVLDGRDIGTVVFPQAGCKVFLTASVDERARRRYEELKAKGQTVDLEQIKHDIAVRDKKDSERELAPLKQAEDAVLVDTSALTIDQVVATILKLVRERQ
ncbi:MAG: (d)CMP kinase [Acidaminococcaceae bacterium]|jgi:cytidylate kinase|nr:(d)CMP kinase [Acidaminococcaceae bacterium]